MTSSHQANNPGINNIAISTIQADTNWIRSMRNKSILILAIAGIIVFILSIIYQNLYFAIIRGFIFLIAILVMYYKSDSILNYRIQFYGDGKIIVKKGLKSSIIFGTSVGSIHLVKKGKNWLIGIKKEKVPIEAFPNLDKKIKAIKC